MYFALIRQHFHRKRTNRQTEQFITMEEESLILAQPFRILQSYFEILFYESIVENDHRLRMIVDKDTSQYPNNFEAIVKLGWAVAKRNCVVKSHPIVIYLNRSSLKM